MSDNDYLHFLEGVVLKPSSSRNKNIEESFKAELRSLLEKEVKNVQLKEEGLGLMTIAFATVLILYCRRQYRKSFRSCKVRKYPHQKYKCMIAVCDTVIKQLSSGDNKCTIKYKDNPVKKAKCQRALTQEISRVEHRKSKLEIKYLKAKAKFEK